MYIGNNVLLLPGITIGDNTVIAADSIVTKSFPDNSIIGGNPARIISDFNEYKQKALSYNVKTKGYSPSQKRVFLMQLPESNFISK